jgi:hypothetical protein
MRKILSLLMLFISACTGIPEGLKPVSGFEFKRKLCWKIPLHLQPFWD